jgi:hypothetical protein
MFNNFSREAALIVVSTAGVRITSSETVLGPRSLLKGRILIRTVRARERSEYYKSGKGESTSPPLQNFQKEPPS